MGRNGFCLHAIRFQITVIEMYRFSLPSREPVTVQKIIDYRLERNKKAGTLFNTRFNTQSMGGCPRPVKENLLFRF